MSKDFDTAFAPSIAYCVIQTVCHHLKVSKDSNDRMDSDDRQNRKEIGRARLLQVAIQFLVGQRLTASGLWAANLRPDGNLY